MDGPLEGIKVLDLSRHLAGPFAAMTLGDLGADVIKVETPGTGDDTRRFPPTWNGISTYYLSTNRNKRGITLDLKSTQGQEIARRLAAESDIVLENFRRGTTERFNLGYAQLSELNPRIIYVAISAFGSDGPDRDKAGVDLLMQAATGLMSITGEQGRPPVRAGTSLIDLTAGANAVQGILAALYVRERTGLGQRIEVSLLGAGVSWLTYHATAYFATGEIPSRMGSSHAAVAPYGAYPTGDGYLVVAVATDALWRRFCAVLGLDGAVDDPRFASNPNRLEHREALDEMLLPVLAQKSSIEWSEELSSAGVACGPVNTLDQTLSMPQVLYDDLVVDLPHPTIPDFRMPGIAIKMKGTPGTIRRPPPELGQHNDEVLTELGYGAQAIDDMRREGVI
jgi:crotonobetainyl-CoA:carnitine CoA-transferase CaiB-like acyl-CoA transferase